MLCADGSWHKLSYYTEPGERPLHFSCYPWYARIKKPIHRYIRQSYEFALHHGHHSFLLEANSDKQRDRFKEILDVMGLKYEDKGVTRMNTSFWLSVKI